MTLLNSSYNYSEVYLWRKQAYSVAVPVMVGICLLVMGSNLAILLILRLIKIKFSSTMRFTISLVISDVWTSVVVAFSMVYNSYLTVVSHVDVNPCVALTFEAIRTGGLLTGCLHLLAMAANHYIVIVCPFVHYKILSPRKSTAVIVLLWIVPPLVMLTCFASIQSQGYQSPDGRCYRVAFFHQLKFRLSFFVVICSFMVIMSGLYASVLHIQTKRCKRLPTGKLNRQMCRRRRTLWTTVIICGTFILGWMPTSVVFVLTCTTCPLAYYRRSLYTEVFISSVLANLCILLKSLINPIVYVIRIPEIRRAIFRTTDARWTEADHQGKRSNASTANRFSSVAAAIRLTRRASYDRTLPLALLPRR